MNENVRWLDVAVVNAGFVKLAEPLGDSVGDHGRLAEPLAQGQTGSEGRLERGALDPVGGEKAVASVHETGPPPSPDASQQRRFAGDDPGLRRAASDLQRDEPPRLGVARTPDRRRRPLRNALDSRPDQGRVCQLM